MKITREIIDNGKKIIHINYSNKDVAEAIEKYKKEHKDLEKIENEIEAGNH